MMTPNASDAMTMVVNRKTYYSRLQELRNVVNPYHRIDFDR